MITRMRVLGHLMALLALAACTSNPTNAASKDPYSPGTKAQCAQGADVWCALPTTRLHTANFVIRLTNSSQWLQKGVKPDGSVAGHKLLWAGSHSAVGINETVPLPDEAISTDLQKYLPVPINIRPAAGLASPRAGLEVGGIAFNPARSSTMLCLGVGIRSKTTGNQGRGAMLIIVVCDDTSSSQLKLVAGEIIKATSLKPTN